MPGPLDQGFFGLAAQNSNLFAAPPIQPVPTFNIAGALGIQGPMAMMVNSAVQSIIPSVFNMQGGVFGQFNPTMNLHTQLQNNAAFAMQQEAMRAAAAQDQRAYLKAFQGAANLTGANFGDRERAGAATMSRDLSAMMPFFAMADPDFFDRLHGSRGSAVIMAQRMAEGARFAMDPTSGMLGMGKENFKGIQQQVFDRLFGETADVSRMRGITAGQAGSMFSEMVSRGLMGGGGVNMQAMAASTGKSVDDLLKMSSTEFSTKVQGFEAERISQKLEGMAGAISAMKDIFGEAGQPDAPIGQLMNALELLTQNGLASKSPQEVEMLVRNAGLAAKRAGMSMQAMTTLMANAGQLTDQMGLNRNLAPQIGIAAATGASVRGELFGGVQGFGMPTKQNMAMTEMRAQASAAGSDLAKNHSALIAMQEAGIDLGPELSSYVQKLKTASGPDVMLSEDEIKSKLGNNIVKFNAFKANDKGLQEYTEKYNIGGKVASLFQGREAQGRVSSQLANAILTNRLFGEGTTKQETEAITAKSKQLSDFVAGQVMNMNSDQLQRYNKGDFGFLADEALKAGLIKQDQVDTFKSSMALGRLNIDTFARNNRYESGNAFLVQYNARAADAIRAEEGVRNAEANVQKAFSRLGRGTAMQRAADLLMNAGPKANLKDLIRGGIGEIPASQLQYVTQAFSGFLEADGTIKARFSTSDLIQDAGKLKDVQDEGLMKKYGVSPEEYAKNIQGKSIDNISRYLRTRASTNFAEALSKVDAGVLSVLEDNAATVSPAAVNNVISSIQRKSGGSVDFINTLARSFTEGTVGARTTLSKAKREEAQERLSGTAAALDKIAKIFTGSDREKAVTGKDYLNANKTDAGTAAFAPLVSEVERAEKNLSGIKKGSIGDILKEIGATDAQKAEAAADLAERENILKADAALREKTDPASLEERKKLQNKYRDVESRLRKRAQEGGYNVESLEAGFKSSLTQKQQEEARVGIKQLVNAQNNLIRSINDPNSRLGEASGEIGRRAAEAMLRTAEGEASAVGQMQSQGTASTAEEIRKQGERDSAIDHLMREMEADPKEVSNKAAKSLLQDIDKSSKEWTDLNPVSKGRLAREAYLVSKVFGDKDKLSDAELDAIEKGSDEEKKSALKELGGKENQLIKLKMEGRSVGTDYLNKLKEQEKAATTTASAQKFQMSGGLTGSLALSTGVVTLNLENAQLGAM